MPSDCGQEDGFGDTIAGLLVEHCTGLHGRLRVAQIVRIVSDLVANRIIKGNGLFCRRHRILANDVGKTCHLGVVKIEEKGGLQVLAEVFGHGYQVPVNLGLRFSAKAVTASSRSFEGMMLALIEATYFKPSSTDLPTP